MEEWEDGYKGMYVRMYSPCGEQGIRIVPPSPMHVARGD
jgi:hypothetical protein